jgi:SAM-dependent methyltransferase
MEDEENILFSRDYAEWYEEFGFNKAWTIPECDFLEEVFKRYGAKPVRMILDVGCGTGRHCFELARRGYRVTGIDVSPGMIEIAKEKCSSEELEVKFYCKDMRELDFHENFDAAYILFTTFPLLAENEDAIKALNGIWNALREEGLVVIEVGNVWYSIAGGKFKPEGVYEWTAEKGAIRMMRKNEWKVDFKNNINHRTLTTRRWKNGQELPIFIEKFDARLYSLNEIDLLCRLTGFKIVKTFGKAEIKADFEDFPQGLIVVLRKTHR